MAGVFATSRLPSDDGCSPLAVRHNLTLLRSCGQVHRVTYLAPVGAGMSNEGFATPRLLLEKWQEAHGDLEQRFVSRFLDSPEVSRLCDLPADLAVRAIRAQRAHQRLTDAVGAAVRDQNAREAKRADEREGLRQQAPAGNLSQRADQHQRDVTSQASDALRRDQALRAERKARNRQLLEQAGQPRKVRCLCVKCERTFVVAASPRSGVPAVPRPWNHPIPAATGVGQRLIAAVRASSTSTRSTLFDAPDLSAGVG